MTTVDLKKEMLNIACPIMLSFHSDIVYDFEELEKCKIGEALNWFIRERGTHLYSDADCDRIGSVKILKQFRITRNNVDDYDISEVIK